MSSPNDQKTVLLVLCEQQANSDQRKTIALSHSKKALNYKQKAFLALEHTLKKFQLSIDKILRNNGTVRWLKQLNLITNFDAGFT